MKNVKVEPTKAESVAVRQHMKLSAAINVDDDECTVLRRYHEMTCAWDDSFPRHKIDGSIGLDNGLDFCVCYAVAGNAYFEEMYGVMNHTLLHAALLLTIALPTYLDPPSFKSSKLEGVYIVLSGLSSIADLFSILLTTVNFTAMMRPYRSVDTMIARIRYTYLLASSTICDYIGVITLVSLMFVLAYDRSYVDGYVLSYVFALVLFLVYCWVRIIINNNETQYRNDLEFKKKYCDDNGHLREEWLDKLGIGVAGPHEGCTGAVESEVASNNETAREETIKDFLASINCSTYLDQFNLHDIKYEQLPELTFELLGKVGVSKVGHQITIMKAIPNYVLRHKLEGGNTTTKTP